MRAEPFRLSRGRLTRGGQPFVVRGVNYHPSRTGTAMWRDFDLAEISRDFAAIAASGFNTVRLFLYWRDIQPDEAGPSAAALERVRQCVESAGASGLACVLSLMTIWMNGERLDLPWRRDRDLWCDPGMLAQEERYVEAVAGVLAGCSGLLALDLGDEVSNVAPADAARLTAAELAGWYARLRGAIRRAAPAVLVCQANDASAVFGTSAFTVANPGPLDLNAVHGFPTWAAGAIESGRSVKATNLVPFLYSASSAFRPTLIDELASYGTSEDVAAGYLGAAAASLLANGGLGFIAWCWQDLAYSGEPFDDRPLERLMGLHRIDGTAKPAMAALTEVIRAAGALRRSGRARIALYLADKTLVAAGSYLDSGSGCLAGFYSYLLLKRAHLDFDVVAGDLAGYDLAFCPSARQLTARDLARFEEVARRGGTVYISLGHYLNGFPGAELTGVRPVDFSLLPAAHAEMSWGDERWPLAWPPHLLPAAEVELAGAEVLGSFPDGRPALTEHRVGRGRIVFCAVPYELQIDGPGRLESCSWHCLYARVAELAGIAPRLRCSDPDIEIAPLNRDSGTPVFAVNHRSGPVTATVEWEGSGRTLGLTMAGREWRIITDEDGGTDDRRR
jgi:hypothetical protein